MRGMACIWKPNVTVAALMERDGRFLLVAEIEACRECHRSPLVLQCVRDYLAGRRYPLEVIRHLG